ncbi:MAG TPA: hypothetical protein VE074_03075 [Jatrophihabitantaceae bacterium]|nr:hypothetical protein [Jatrophihabitantaceae bacterium]
MLRPIGSLSPAVYWRRRLLFVGAVLLTVLTVYVVFVSGDDKKKPVGAQTSGPTPTKRTSTPAAVPCVPSVLSIAAQTQAKRYQVGQQPELEIQVTNTGQAPCVANLSDSQIELLVYNGESRVWGSHDCQVQPGASPLTLTPRQSVRRSIRWTGLSSQPHCAGHRQRVGSGNYTLHARFGQMDGHTATFSIG